MNPRGPTDPLPAGGRERPRRDPSFHKGLAAKNKYLETKNEKNETDIETLFYLFSTKNK